MWQGIVDAAIKKVEAQGHSIGTVLVYDHALAARRADVAFVEGRDVWWQDVVPRQPTECSVEWMGAEDPLFKVCIPWLTVSASKLQRTPGGAGTAPACQEGRKIGATTSSPRLQLQSFIHQLSHKHLSCKLRPLLGCAS